MNTLTTNDHESVGEIVAFAKFKPLTKSDLMKAHFEKEAAMICEMHRRAREAEEIRAAAPTHQGVSQFVMDDASEQVSTYRFPRLLRDAFPGHKHEYIDNSLRAKLGRAMDWVKSLIRH